MKVYEVYSMLARGELADGTKINTSGGESYIVTNNEIYHTYYNTPLSAYNNVLNKDFMNEEVELIPPKEKKYYLRLDEDNDFSYINWNVVQNHYKTASQYETKTIKTKFTQEEIDESMLLKFIEKGQVICWKKKVVFPISKPEIRIMIETLEGVMQARPGDYIIRGVNGEYYPCKPDIFVKTYETVE